MALRKASNNGRTGPNRRPSAKEAFRKLKQDRERYEQAGLGPGDAYRGMWAYLHDSLAALRQAKTDERRDYFRHEYATTLYRILPFERPRLQTVKLQGDPDAPVLDPEQMAETIAKMLTQDEIAILDRVAIKLVTRTGDGTTFDTAGNLIGGIDASRGGRADEGPALRRKASLGSGKARRELVDG
jgi:hypothetical protein